MLKKIVLICLIGLLGMVSVPHMAWGDSLPNGILNARHNTTYWLAQSEPNPQAMPSQAPSLDSSKKTSDAKATSSTSEQAPSPQRSPEQLSPEQLSPEQLSPEEKVSPAKTRDQSKPFNPYDMKALKQFDKGSHRTQ